MSLVKRREDANTATSSANSNLPNDVAGILEIRKKNSSINAESVKNLETREPKNKKEKVI